MDDQESAMNTLKLTDEELNYVRYAVRRTVKEDWERQRQLVAKFGDDYKPALDAKNGRIRIGKVVHDKVKEVCRG